MQPVFKTRDKAEAEEQQRRYYWSLTPQQRLALAVRLNAHARLLCPAAPTDTSAPAHGRRVFKSTAPIPRGGR